MLIVPEALFLASTFTRRWFWAKHDWLWVAGLVLVSVASLYHQTVTTEMATIGLMFLAYKGATALKDPHKEIPYLFLGALTFFSLFSVVQVFVLGADRAAGPGWIGHPNLNAYILLILGVTVANMVRLTHRLPVLLLTFSSLAMTGSRSGLIAFIIAVILCAVVDRRLLKSTYAFLLLAGVGVIGLSAAMPASTWAQRISSPLAAAFNLERTARNMLIHTEKLNDTTTWNALGVEVLQEHALGRNKSVWTVVRTEPADWARPQQSVELSGGEAYTLSAYYHRSTMPVAASDSTPGFIGWGGDQDSRVLFYVTAQLSGPQIVRQSGLAMARVGIERIDSNWIRLVFTFALEQDYPASVAIGVSPGISSEIVGDRVVFSQLQLERGTHPTPYRPSINQYAGQGEALVRLDIAQAAWAGVIERPWFGHGPGAFPHYYSQHSGSDQLITHAHNIVLESWFSLGLGGLAALSCVLMALWKSAAKPQRALLIGIIVGNMFDSTLASGAVAYLVAFAVPLRLTLSEPAS